MPLPGPFSIRFRAGAAAVPGVQSTYISPISDWGLIAHVASAWKGVKRASLISSVTAALFWVPVAHAAVCATHTSSDAIEPTGAPAIRTCSPGTANDASSKMALTL